MPDMLNIDDKSLTDKFYDIIDSELNEKILKIKYLGGGSNGKAYSVVLSDNETIVMKVYRFVGTNETEASQLKIFSKKYKCTYAECFNSVFNCLKN